MGEMHCKRMAVVVVRQEMDCSRRSPLLQECHNANCATNVRCPFTAFTCLPFSLMHVYVVCFVCVCAVWLSKTISIH